MEIRNDMTEDILTLTKTIESINVEYKKKKKYLGTLASVNRSPFEVRISDKKNKLEPEHTVDFDLAEQITINFFDGTVKTYQDDIA